MIQNADKVVPKATKKVAKVCTRCETRFAPNNMMPRNVASRKKAVVAIARQLAVDLWRIFTGAAKAETFGLIYLPDAV